MENTQRLYMILNTHDKPPLSVTVDHETSVEIKSTARENKYGESVGPYNPKRETIFGVKMITEQEYNQRFIKLNY